MRHYARHAPAADEIYCALMAERTGENPDNYRGRPFCAELLDFAPSGHIGIDLNFEPMGTDGTHAPPPRHVWPFPPAKPGTPIRQEFGPIPPMPYQPPGGHPGEY